MINLSPTAIQARTFIYALDPNRHLLADAPFLEFLAHLVLISARPEGLPVPEWGLLQARALSGDNTFWKEIADELLACVQKARPAIPLGIPEDPEEVWRRKIFTYPPGRYAILRCGKELMRVAAETHANPASLCRRWKHFQSSANPWERAVARAAIDSMPTPRNFRMGLKTWIRREEIRAKDGERSALQIALAAAGLARQPKPANRQKHT